MTKKLLILAGDTDGNLGDLAIVTATCDAIRATGANVEISMVTGRADRDRASLHIVPLRRGWRGLASLIRAARKADLIICGGGGLFQDDNSLLKMPYWACRLLLLRLFASRMAGFSIGVGPLDYRISRLFARMALSTLDPVSVRDTNAKTCVSRITRKPVFIVPDPAFMLSAADASVATAVLDRAGIPQDGPPLIGVALRQWFHMKAHLIPHKFAVKYGLRRIAGTKEMSRFVHNVASVLDGIAEAHNAFIVFLPSYNVPHENDSAVCHQVARRMNCSRHRILELDDPRVYKAIVARFAAMLCGRMHPAILAASQGVPVVGISYNQKFQGLFDLLGQPGRCLQVESFLQPDIENTVGTLLAAALISRSGNSDRPKAMAAQTDAYLRELLRSAEILDDNHPAQIDAA